jgi:hypothetical protein
MEPTRKNSPAMPLPINRLQTLMLRLSFGGYFIYLTLLLLTPNPFRLVPPSTGIVHLLYAIYPLAHGISFAFLTLFALLAFRALSLVAIGVGLSGYATVTELLQLFIPPRTAEWQDWFQDIGGITFAFLVIWILAIAWKTLRNVREEVIHEIVS